MSKTFWFSQNAKLILDLQKDQTLTFCSLFLTLFKILEQSVYSQHDEVEIGQFFGLIQNLLDWSKIILDLQKYQELMFCSLLHTLFRILEQSVYSHHDVVELLEFFGLVQNLLDWSKTYWTDPELIGLIQNFLDWSKKFWTGPKNDTLLHIYIFLLQNTNWTGPKLFSTCKRTRH